MQPSPNGRRVGIRIVTFEACSGFTRVTARRIAQPPKVTFVTRLQPCQLPNRAARQLQDLSTIIQVEPSSTDDSRLRGAPPIPDEHQLGATVGLTPAIPAKVGRLQGTCVVRPALHAWLQQDLWPKLLLEKSQHSACAAADRPNPGGGASCADRDARISPTPGRTAAAASRRLEMHGNCFATLGVALVGRAVKSFASPA